MHNSISIQKNSQTYYFTQHSLERIQERTNLSISQIKQSFEQSKLITHQNINKFPQFKQSFYNKQSSHLQFNTKLFYSFTNKIQFRVDAHNNNICTIISF